MLKRIPHPTFLMVFPPLQFSKEELVRPDGTLGLAYLDAALTAAGFSSEILDMSVGTEEDRLEDTFFRNIPLTGNLSRIGMTEERILQEVKKYDVIAITSIFTQQTSRCLHLAELIKNHYPEKILIAGGVNARSLKDTFFKAGFDVLFVSESEKPIVEFAKYLHTGTPSLAEVPGIVFRQDGKTVATAPPVTTMNLDDYPMPSWTKLPYKKYWQIGRIWGGREGWMEGDGSPPYASIFTSRGCPFRCSYCHISVEQKGETGSIGKYRMHSTARVKEELEHLKDLGVKYLFINDDSFLAKREHVFPILKLLRDHNFILADVNGVNIRHLFERVDTQKYVVDERLMDELYAAGFRKLSLPFESGTQRVLDKYANSKWKLSQFDVDDLVKKLNKHGIAADGNFMIGYPDESPEELTNTFLLARRMMDAGLVGCQFFMVQPFPGSVLFDESISNGQLSKDWHWDTLGWSKGSVFQHPLINPDTLKFSWSLVWKLLNQSHRVSSFSSQKNTESPIEETNVGVGSTITRIDRKPEPMQVSVN